MLFIKKRKKQPIAIGVVSHPFKYEIDAYSTG